MKIAITIMAMVLLLHCACSQAVKTNESEPKLYPLHVGDIEFDPAIDNPDFMVPAPGEQPLHPRTKY